jgi:hypothetical protein
MISPVWYSAALRLCVIIGGIELVDQVRSVVVFRADDFDDALTRSLEVGRRLECTFTNGDGKEVRWALASVETLDELGDVITDGREIYSEPLGAGDGIVPALSPERSTPTQSGV